MNEAAISKFIEYNKLLKGYEKGEGQVFLERLFQAFGHEGLAESGVILEYKLKIDKTTKFPDLIWPGKVLIEMKSRGENLDKHWRQAKAYWDNTFGEKRTKYVILCNFDEFWIFDWNHQKDPLDKVQLSELKDRWIALAFLTPNQEIKPQFENNLVEVTKEAADKLVNVYNSLVARKIDPTIAQRYTLQCLIALFAEDTNLFPRPCFFKELIDDCLDGQSSYDLFHMLFNQMNSSKTPEAGRFKGVDYFNGGIFSEIYPIELNKQELESLKAASKANWSKIQPSIFGAIFEDSMGKEERHAWGAHFTYESDIMRIVEPTILRTFRNKIHSAKTLGELNKIWNEMSEFKVLDPACGSGNFLYIAYRELKHLEIDLLTRILDEYKSLIKEGSIVSRINCNQFYGIDKNSFAVELAKVTLSMAKKLASDELNKFKKDYGIQEGFEFDKPLPFDNLEQNIICDDALFCEWPKTNVIIGNPPFQSKNKMVPELGIDYVDRVRKAYPEIPGRADYCVYWIRKAHDELSEGGRAGLVGTNTIRQNYSRIGGLDYIVSTGGQIYEAISSMPWSGEAVVYVSIVNWTKGQSDNISNKRLLKQKEDKIDAEWQMFEIDKIPSSLSPLTDVTQAKNLQINGNSNICHQGQTHGNDGFLLSYQEANDIIKKEPINKEVIFPYLIANELVGNKDSKPKRCVIDINNKTLFEAQKYRRIFKILEQKVLPKVIENAEKEIENNKNSKKKVNVRQNHLKKWWTFWRSRNDLINQINNLTRYIVCSRHTKRPIFEFVSSKIRPNDALTVFTTSDDFSFGILSSSIHWEWFKARCSTIKGDPRYTSETVFDTFPWPQWGIVFTNNQEEHLYKYQSQIKNKILKIAQAAKELREIRNKIKVENDLSLREIYKLLELPGDNSLKVAQNNLDKAVQEAYFFGCPKEIQSKNILEFLLELNDVCYEAEHEGLTIQGPGLPDFCKDEKSLFSDDCIEPPDIES
ncbi:MAG: hypothetical protein ACD_20C00124G0012 [uncultured bacterium]|nr:MAG: hypothetical protein ACD_20C00124G0012 [uncultured bacterium]